MEEVRQKMGRHERQDVKGKGEGLVLRRVSEKGRTIRGLEGGGMKKGERMGKRGGHRLERGKGREKGRGSRGG